MFCVYSLFHVYLQRQAVSFGPLFGNSFKPIGFGVEFDVEPFRNIDRFSLGQPFDISLVERAGVDVGPLLPFTINMTRIVTRCNFPSLFISSSLEPYYFIITF